MKIFVFLTPAIRLTLLTYLIFGTGQSYAGDRLLATGGVVQLEGAGGGGLNPWALITGYGTDEQIGLSANYTKARTNGGYEIDSGGFGVGFYNRLELSFNQTKFGLSNTVPHESIKLDTVGVKLRVLGDAVYDQDNWIPQVAVGVQYKKNEDFRFVPKLVGGQHGTGVDFYIAATKLYLGAIYGRNLLLNANLQATKANQFGLLGFGGDKHDSYDINPAFSAALMLNDNLFIGAEYRTKPNNVKTFEEDDAKDLFLTWFPTRNFSITSAYVDLGNIADKDNQRAWYLSGQISY
jgi:Protein of unknown function (DUF3034)